MRYNSFNQIHKALRHMLYTTASRIQQADLSLEDESRGAIDQLEDTLHLFESHAENEDKFVLPLIARQAPDVVASFEAEHVEDHRLGDELQQGITAWRKANNNQERFECGQKIFYSLNEFIAFNLYHMNKEESLLNGILWKHYTDDEIRLAEQAIIRNTPPEKMMRYATWMIRSINNTELIHWLGGVKLNAPSFMFDNLLQLTKQELSRERFEKVEQALEKDVAGHA